MRKWPFFSGNWWWLCACISRLLFSWFASMRFCMKFWFCDAGCYKADLWLFIACFFKWEVLTLLPFTKLLIAIYVLDYYWNRYFPELILLFWRALLLELRFIWRRYWIYYSLLRESSYIVFGFCLFFSLSWAVLSSAVPIIWSWIISLSSEFVVERINCFELILLWRDSVSVPNPPFFDPPCLSFDNLSEPASADSWRRFIWKLLIVFL